MPRYAKTSLPRKPTQSRVLPGEVELDEGDDSLDFSEVEELDLVALQGRTAEESRCMSSDDRI